MQPLQLVYKSHPVPSCDEAEVRGLVEAARIANQARDITGCLLYRPGRFLQVIEGPPGAVTELFARIVHDERHQDVLLIGAQRVPTRAFRDWRMGLVTIRDEVQEAQVAGGFTLVEDDSEGAVDYVLRIARRLGPTASGLRPAAPPEPSGAPAPPRIVRPPVVRASEPNLDNVVPFGPFER